jgi:UrcA family protein
MSHAFAWRPAALAGLALIPAVGLGAGPAMAQNADTQVRTMALHYGDLDLSTAKGRSALDARLRRTAAQVCGSETGMRSLPEAEAFRACYNEALKQAHRTLVLKQQETQLVRR